jgi:hypothetical protein
VVFGSGADHGGAADIDVLHDRLKIGAARDGGLERIEIDHEQIDAFDPVRPHGMSVARLVAIPEKRAMDFRVQRLDPAIHDFREAGDVRNVGHRDARRTQGARRSTGRDQLNAEPGKPAREVGKTGLVGDGNQGAADRPLGHQATTKPWLHVVLAFAKPKEKGHADGAGRC